jgi:hypothetical protein
MRVTQEKIQQYVGIKFGEDIASKIKNKKLVVLTPPKYSDAIKLRHQEYERLIKEARQPNESSQSQVDHTASSSSCR